MQPRFWIFGGVCLLLGALAGAWWASSKEEKAQKLVMDSEKRLTEKLSEAERENVVLRKKLAESGAASEVSPAPPAISSPAVAVYSSDDIAARLKILMEAKRAGVAAAVRVLDRTGKLDNAFIGTFGLTAAEVAQFEEKMESSRRALEKLELANSICQVSLDGKVTISTNAFPKDGGRLYDQTLSELGQVLGPDRNAAFVDLCGDQLEKGLRNFGTEDRKIELTPDPNKARRYKLRIEYKTDGSSGSRSGEVRNRQEIEQEIGRGLAGLVPKSFE